jgi:enterobacteria phage integrase
LPELQLYRARRERKTPILPRPKKSMAPKKRNTDNSDLTGTNIKVSVKGGKEYYYYIMPDGKHEPLAHGDRKTSIEAAMQLNRALRPSGSVAERIINAPPKPTTKNPLFIEVLDQFEREWLPEQNYSKRVIQDRKQRLNRYRAEWPHEKIGSLDTFALATFMRKFSPESATKHKQVLEPLFRFAASRGYETQNPMINIERRKVPKRKRARHTWAGHLAIYNAAPEWLQRAILIALYSLQRRSDLIAINIREHINMDERTIRVLQQKSRNYDKPVFIDIGMGDELFDVVTTAIKSDVPCPYLIHYRPERIKDDARAAKPHPFAVTPEYLSKAYSKVRDSVGAYSHLPAIERPGIHSLRALGIWLYTKAGYSDEYIMALAGHATEKMKAHYTEGHERATPVKVSAGLSLGAIDLSAVDWENGVSSRLKSIAENEN